jgi:PLP dependent protein
MTSDLARNYREIVERIEAACARSGRDPRSVRLVAVTKKVSPDRIRQAIDCGVTDIGENRLQEALGKREALADLKVTWHFIGHLQTNKARKVAETFDWVHSIDRADVAERLNDYATGKRLPVLLEVKLGGEATKSGVEPQATPLLVNIVRGYENLDLCGLMTVPPPVENPEFVRGWFRWMREQAKIYRFTELSMGMSGDFEVAIEEGATMIRVGTALFGERQ